MIRHCQNSRGFTLIEMMIVVSIISILLTLAMPNFQKALIRARETSLRKTLFTFRDMIDQFYADHESYPETLQDLVEQRYLRTIPPDPFTGSTDSWIIIAPDSEGKGQVYDVHSGSDRIGLNEIPYNEW